MIVTALSQFGIAKNDGVCYNATKFSIPTEKEKETVFSYIDHEVVKMKIPFSPPDITESEVQEVAEALRSGWITTGPRTKELEKEVAEFCGAARCVCLNSQTACSEMALRALGIGKGDEVITSAYTYTASASVIDHVGAKIVLVDTAKDSFEMDYDKMEEAITERTKAIIPVDLGGVPCDYDRIFAAVEKKKNLFRPKTELQKKIGRVVVLADTAHSLGASYHGTMTGAVADFSAFSFHAVKNLTTAEGGALTWRKIEGVDDDELYRTFQLLSLHGQSKDALAKTKLGAWEYDIVGPWYKCNMTDVAAAMGLAQMKRYPAMLCRRKALVEKYDDAFLPLGIKTLFHYRESRISSGHLYLTRIPDIGYEERGEIIEKMAEKGIACNVHYKPLPMHTAYKNLGFDVKDFPNAYAQFENEITLPLHTRLSDEEVDYVIESFSEIVKAYLK